MKFGSSRTSGFSVSIQAPLASLDRLILRRREADVLRVVDDPAATLELLQDVYCPVSGGVVNDDDLFPFILLLQDGFETSLDEPATVVRHYRDGYVVVLGHAVYVL